MIWKSNFKYTITLIQTNFNDERNLATHDGYDNTGNRFYLCVEPSKRYFTEYCASKSHGNKGKKYKSQKQRSNQEKQNDNMNFDNKPISNRTFILNIGMKVHCFDGDLCSEKNYVGIASIDVIYEENQCWCYSDENKINYHFWVIPV